MHGAKWTYRRRVAEGWVTVEADKDRLQVDYPAQLPAEYVRNQVATLFDLHAPMADIFKVLAADPLLGRWVKQAPGLCVMGAWDPFETSVRAILGQQVSVERGRALALAMIDRYGAGEAFPSPSQLVDKDIAELGMPGRRGAAIRHLATAVLEKQVSFEAADPEAFEAEVVALNGIGPWTANYIRVRVLHDRDAFPHNDWVVLKQLDVTPGQAKRLAQQWSPFRAYALMYLWYAASNPAGES